MRAQQVPKSFKGSWPDGRTVLARVEVTRAARTRRGIAHSAQDARKIRLQHINNSHPNATANDPQ